MAAGAAEIMLGGFAVMAKRFSASVDAAIAQYGDELIDPKLRPSPQLLETRTALGGIDQAFSNIAAMAPDAAASLPRAQYEAVRAALSPAFAASDLLYHQTGPASLAPLAALRDAVDGLARVAAEQATTWRPVRVVVGGTGTAGLAVANLLRDAGVEVMVVAPKQQARLGSVMIDRRGWGVLERAGGAKVLEQAPVDPSGNYAMASFDALEDPLHGAALLRGTKFADDHLVQAVEDTGDGVRVTVSRQDGSHAQTLDADWYVDATAGHSPVARSEAFRRELFEGTFQALPSERPFHAVAARAVPERGLGWSAPDGSFAVNDVRSGRLTAYRGFGGEAPEISSETASDMLRALDVDPTTMLGEPWSFTARQTLARSTAQGRTLIVGDGAGTVLPHQQAGIFLALTDAERAAKTIIASRTASREAIEAAVQRYDEQTRLARSGATFGDDGELLEQVVADATEQIAEATERATRAHDQGTRAMHRMFLA